MSGGHFDYRQFNCEEMADSIDRLIARNNTKDEYGCANNYPTEILDRFAEAAHTLRVAGAMAHRVDWLVCGDDGEDCFMRRWDEELSKIVSKPARNDDGFEWDEYKSSRNSG